MSTSWIQIDVGKRYRHLTIPQLVFRDPDYFFWAFNSGMFNQRPELRLQAQKVYTRSRNTRIPDQDGRRRVIELIYYNRSPYGLVRIDPHFVPASEPLISPRGTTWSPTIDLSVAHEGHRYSKSGGRLLVACVKRLVLGDPKIRMTKKRCEEFVDNDSNFVF